MTPQYTRYKLTIVQQFGMEIVSSKTEATKILEEPMPKPFPVTDADFQEKVINSSNPVLVDFWADWCTPCKMIAPIVDELAEELDGQVEFAKVDVDSNPETAISYGIRSIPALIVFKDGKPVEQIIGAVPKGQIRKKLDEVLGV